MKIFLALGKMASSRWAWLTLMLSAVALIITALYFQYILELKPCIMCIYQRTAVFGLLFAGLLPVLKNNLITRFIGFVVWGVSAIWGMFIAIEHVELQNASNPFFVSCEIVPNFPSFLPLHNWLPNMFAATGDCGNIDWEFMSMSMPQWMIVVFAIYSGVFAIVLFSRLFTHRRF
ncbi:disulfide bond formation protein DsbB [Aliiglaciecola lipolytica]|uniref:Disulfide bond formation protein B n=1 Tax=Aliiglaciecola lipolytica E3 TaxID=1127673 RepID=K6YQG7_9ALTE|nr:disulfide bond formation protein DsbB [Aliiglaciecola lipolytica]GAC13575.1 disulfide bond formation protein DsbB [Aliiglaciecola lipolytica E3]